jgi:hypothetical protein
MTVLETDPLFLGVFFFRWVFRRITIDCGLPIDREMTPKDTSAGNCIPDFLEEMYATSEIFFDDILKQYFAFSRRIVHKIEHILTISSSFNIISNIYHVVDCVVDFSSKSESGDGVGRSIEN